MHPFVELHGSSLEMNSAAAELPMGTLALLNDAFARPEGSGCSRPREELLQTPCKEISLNLVPAPTQHFCQRPQSLPLACRGLKATAITGLLKVGKERRTHKDIPSNCRCQVGLHHVWEQSFSLLSFKRKPKAGGG